MGFVRFYLLYWIVDMVVGVGLCLVGFFTPIVYVRLTLSPLSAAESYGFLVATVVFAVYVWRRRRGTHLYLFPASVFVMSFATSAAQYFSLERLRPNRFGLEAAQIEAMQTPLYLSVALVCSLAGIALWFWIDPDKQAPQTPEVPSRLRNLREKRQMSMESRR